MKKTLLFIPLLYLILMPACKKDKEPASSLSCSSTYISAPAEGGNYTISVKSSNSWDAWASVSWIELSDDYGYGNGILECRIGQNSSKSSRSGYISITSVDGSAVTIDVNQAGKSDDGGNNNQNTLSAPSNVTAHVDGSYIAISWSAVSGAVQYNVYRASSSYGNYEYLGYIDETSCYDASPLNGSNYYKVSAVDNYGNESSMSSYAYCSFSGSGTGGGTGDNPGGETSTKPSTPTGVTAANEGSTMVPYVVIRWDEVVGATSYIIYRSTSAYGTYSQIGTSDYNVFSDSNPMDGANYYKVAAKNAAGTSSQSSYASVTIDRNAVSPCPPSSMNGSVSGNYLTMRWSISTTSGCGKPDKIRVRLFVPYQGSGTWIDETTLSGTATSYKFYVAPGYIDADGFVKMGIILENDYGTGSALLVYDSKNNKFIGNH